MSNLAIRSIARQVRDLNVAKRGATSLYVDGTNGSDNKTGESWRQAFATIQEAVDVADSWTQIFIKAGTYAENVSITKHGINLIGEQRDNVIIAPTSGNALSMSGDACSASGINCIIAEASSSVYAIRITGAYCKLDDMLLTASIGNSRAVQLTSHHAHVSNVYFDSSLLSHGITVEDTSIYPNDIHDCRFDMDRAQSVAIYSLGSYSKIHDNFFSAANGVILAGDENIVYHNNFVNVSDYPILDTEGSNHFVENYYRLHSNIDNGFGIATEPYTNGSTIDPRPVCGVNGWLALSWADADQVADILADVTGLAGAAMRGTDNAALASVCTEARLAELDAANLPTDIDSILANQWKRWNWNCLTDEYMVIVGTWAVQTDTDQYLGEMLYNTSAAQNDEIAIPFFAFSTNPVTLNCRCHTDVTGGIVTVYIDGVSQGTIDTLDNATHNVIKTLSITPARSGLNVIRLKVTDGQFGYDLKFSELWLS